MAKPPPGRFDGVKLREARTALGITQTDLAKRIGVDPGVVNSWETRGAQPSVPNLGRVVTALGLTVPDLYRSDAASAGTLVDLRVRAGQSQREVATRLNCSQSRISSWERGVSRPTSDQFSSYAEVLTVSRSAIGAAVDRTANQHRKPPNRRHAAQTSTFDLTASSPHIIYDFTDTDGSVEISSPQQQMTFITTFTTPPLGRELALINESIGADYFHRYNHLQRRCQGPDADDAVYLIRWLTAFHENNDPETHPRGITASMLIGQVEAAGVLPVTARALPTGEYLLIVVEPEDTVEFLFRQISRDIPVTFYPTRRDDDIRPLTICWDGDSDNPTAWNGTFRHADMPADMTFAELASHLQSSNPPNEMASEPTPAVPQTDMVRGIHRTFSASTSFRFKLPKPTSPRKPVARLGGFLFR